MNKPYAVYSSEYKLQGAELYSGGENDPINDSFVHAQDHLAFDNRGKKLPFSLSLSIFGQEDFDRDIQLLEDKALPMRRFDQRICITVLVWSNLEDYFEYESSDKLYVL